MTKTVNIPDKMFTEIESIVADCPDLGYESVDEFVREAIRNNFGRV
jgi:Arc/MetJ-type ribon-helix-helix transcriptional regulator